MNCDITIYENVLNHLLRDVNESIKQWPVISKNPVVEMTNEVAICKFMEANLLIHPEELSTSIRVLDKLWTAFEIF